MNAGVSSEKEKVKGSQSRRVTPSLDAHFGCRGGGVTLEALVEMGTKIKESHHYRRMIDGDKPRPTNPV